MKIEIFSRSEKFLKDYEYRQKCEIYVDEESVFLVSDGEPEDATLSRDFNDIYRLPDIFKKIFEAGKRDETLEILFKEEEED